MRVPAVADDELVHASWAEGGANGIGNDLTSVDVADNLAPALARVCALTQEDDARLLVFFHNNKEERGREVEREVERGRERGRERNNKSV